MTTGPGPGASSGPSGPSSSGTTPAPVTASSSGTRSRPAGVVVRTARPQDAAEIADVHVRAWRETYPGMLSDELLASLSVPAHERMWGAILGGTDAAGAHVAEREGRIVGFALACTPHEDDAPRDVELGMLYLLDEAKGTGAADALVEAALGGGPAFLWTADLNHRALAFYARHGFRRDGASKRIARWDDILDVRLVR